MAMGSIKSAQGLRLASRVPFVVWVLGLMGNPYTRWNLAGLLGWAGFLAGLA
jgi:hypothetical protein